MEKPESSKEFFKGAEKADPDFLIPREDNPPQERESLDELLDQCDGKNLSLDDEDKAWINDKPMGKETL